MDEIKEERREVIFARDFSHADHDSRKTIRKENRIGGLSGDVALQELRTLGGEAPTKF